MFFQGKFLFQLKVKHILGKQKYKTIDPDIVYIPFINLKRWIISMCLSCLGIYWYGDIYMITRLNLKRPVVQNVSHAYTINEQVQRRKQAWHASNLSSLLAYTEIPTGKDVHR